MESVAVFVSYIIYVAPHPFFCALVSLGCEWLDSSYKFLQENNFYTYASLHSYMNGSTYTDSGRHILNQRPFIEHTAELHHILHLVHSPHLIIVLALCAIDWATKQALTILCTYNDRIWYIGEKFFIS